MILEEKPISCVKLGHFISSTNPCGRGHNKGDITNAESAESLSSLIIPLSNMGGQIGKMMFLYSTGLF